MAKMPSIVINQACLERNLPAVYAGVYERGEGGDVRHYPPVRTAVLRLLGGRTARRIAL